MLYRKVQICMVWERSEEGIEGFDRDTNELCILLHKNSIFVGKVNTVPGLKKRLSLECFASISPPKKDSIITWPSDKV